MRVAFYHSLPRGGAYYMLAEYVKRLGAGHAIDVYWVKSRMDTAHPALQNVRQLKCYPYDLTPPSRCLPGSLLTPLDLGRLDWLNRRVAGDIDAGGYDAVVAFASRHTQAPLVLRHLRTPSLYYCTEPLRAAYEPDTHPLRRPRLRHRMMNVVRWPFLRMLKRVEAGLVKRATMVTTHSHFTGGQIRRFYGRNAVLCRYGVDTARYRPLPGVSRQRLVLSVGAFDWRKGHEDAVRALALVPAAMRPALWVAGQVGSGRECRLLQGLAATLGVELVVHQDSLDDEGLVRLYNQATAVLCMAYGEPFGLTPLESMACGTPVVAVREGGYCETVVDGTTGYLVARSSEAIARCVTELLADPARCQRMGEAGIAHMKNHWKWDEAIVAFEAALRRTVENAHLEQDYRH